MTDELTDNFILSLLNEKPVKRLTRVRTQFPDFPKGGPVKWHDTFSPNKSLRCTSRMCNCPTVYTFRGIPYCTPHLIVLMNWELMNGRPAGFYKDIDDLPEIDNQPKVLNL